MRGWEENKSASQASKEPGPTGRPRAGTEEPSAPAPGGLRPRWAVLGPLRLTSFLPWCFFPGPISRPALQASRPPTACGPESHAGRRQQLACVPEQRLPAPGLKWQLGTEPTGNSEPLLGQRRPTGHAPLGLAPMRWGPRGHPGSAGVTWGRPGSARVSWGWLGSPGVSQGCLGSPRVVRGHLRSPGVAWGRLGAAEKDGRPRPEPRPAPGAQASRASHPRWEGATCPPLGTGQGGKESGARSCSGDGPHPAAPAR